MLVDSGGKIRLAVIGLLGIQMVGAMDDVPKFTANFDMSVEEAMILLYGCYSDEQNMVSPQCEPASGHFPDAINPTMLRQFTSNEELLSAAAFEAAYGDRKPDYK
ncbi:hypothetical protein H4R33_006823 [Dimargaris cristalligena]|uniref:Uncharacterized protein n=1 Tax=Dimargaris cristalligena TaxID=215637 RepID=A0A4P9ZL70_9FUNG|nr:hypothetical protein H4R33_006823 [Dimargaris cristalligena]RKP33855.1 hypothetical protein BJ085DRAFT_29904 [Dimargaris cristalligena]|eukprot:RKP33855.1 hypothetical protein BJ085DRAFT_29904 [Dimargaris cristalligena]